MNGSDIDDAVSLLQRATVLDACRDGPVGRAGIAELADCSRSTAYRATSELEEGDLLERTDRGYRLTGAGAATLEHVQQFVRKLSGTRQLQPLLKYVDHPAFLRRAHLFEDAELVAQDGASPYHIENRVQSLIDGTRERMVGMTTGLGSPALAEAMVDRIREGVRVDWILPAELYEQFNDEYGDLSAQAVEDGQTSVSVLGEMPIDLAIYDETLVVIGFDPARGILGCVAVTDEPAAVRWARGVFADYRGESERVE